LQGPRRHQADAASAPEQPELSAAIATSRQPLDGKFQVTPTVEPSHA